MSDKICARRKLFERTGFRIFDLRVFVCFFYFNRLFWWRWRRWVRVWVGLVANCILEVFFKGRWLGGTLVLGVSRGLLFRFWEFVGGFRGGIFLFFRGWVEGGSVWFVFILYFVF